MLTVHIKQTDFALFEQEALAVHIFRKVLVLIFPDVIRLEIGKYPIIKLYSRHAVEF